MRNPMNSLYSVIDRLPHILPAPLKRILVMSGFPKVIARLPGLDEFALSQLIEPHVCATVKRTIKPGWICADVGANIGRYTLLIARLVGPSGRVIAFEAFPHNARMAQEKCFFWGYKERTHVENVAVSDGADARLWLFPGRCRRSVEWNIVGHDVEGKRTEPELEVAATSLDAYFPKGSRLDFVKIDVEGAEGKVLAGMSRLLRESKPMTLVEFHGEAGWASREHLIAAGYELYDMSGRKLARDSQRFYHVLALPEKCSL
jgi:FkbM family methyltransferase